MNTFDFCVYDRLEYKLPESMSIREQVVLADLPRGKDIYSPVLSHSVHKLNYI